MHNTRLHDTADCYAQQQQRSNGEGSECTRGNNNSGNGNRRRDCCDFNTGRTNMTVTANGTPSCTVIAPAPATLVTVPPTPVTTQTYSMPYVIESPPSGIGYSLLAGFTTSGPLKFTTISDCGAPSDYVHSNPIGDIESRMKDIVKLDPPATIVVAGHSKLRGVSVGTLTVTVSVTDGQDFLHDMLLPAINVSGLGRHLFSGGMVALKGVNTVIAKESYIQVGQFKIGLRKGTESPTIDYLDLERTQRGNYQTEAVFPTRVISGHTIPTGRLWPPEFSRAAPWKGSPLLQQRYGRSSQHLRRREVSRRYGVQLQLMTRAWSVAAPWRRLRLPQRLRLSWRPILRQDWQPLPLPPHWRCWQLP